MKKVYYFLLGILLVLIVTNPSLKDFKENQGHETYEGLTRDTNFFVCSIYVSSGYNPEGTTYYGKYFGILGNFFFIRSKNSD
ncbi:hypothetical protein NAF17_14965 [Mucilaginibacter sp. RB4R14]|uniref:hypothetical protein n=1 Tax=Mucilaginibacter aurantiaciroseus TaxID=2949308 RepID=UPI002090082F|nr:hypothetical protein [Mucilaginibacter aurantiaciroseus]MCO5936842.1 hypothetical protein [Mucilaginibacter aurantiaciroseus]